MAGVKVREADTAVIQARGVAEASNIREKAARGGRRHRREGRVDEGPRRGKP